MVCKLRMSIDRYFLRQSDMMPRRKNQTADASDGLNQQANTAEVEANSAVQAGTDANLLLFREAVVSDITTNISKLIDEKLGPISELLKKQGDTLDSHEKRLTETEQRISALEDTATPVNRKLEDLERKVDYLNGRVDDLENRGRRKNIRILGFPEGIEGDDPTRFFLVLAP